MIQSCEKSLFLLSWFSEDTAEFNMSTCSEKSKLSPESLVPSVASSSIPPSPSFESPLTFSNDEKRTAGPFSRKKRKRTEGWMRPDSDEDICVENELTADLSSHTLSPTPENAMPDNTEREERFSPLQDLHDSSDSLEGSQLDLGQSFSRKHFLPRVG